MHPEYLACGVIIIFVVARLARRRGRATVRGVLLFLSGVRRLVIGSALVWVSVVLITFCRRCSPWLFPAELPQMLGFLGRGIGALLCTYWVIAFGCAIALNCALVKHYRNNETVRDEKARRRVQRSLRVWGWLHLVLSRWRGVELSDLLDRVVYQDSSLTGRMHVSRRRVLVGVALLSAAACLVASVLLIRSARQGPPPRDRERPAELGAFMRVNETRVFSVVAGIVYKVILSQNGKSFAALVTDQTFTRRHVLRDGARVGGEYEEAWSLKFSPDGRSLAFVAKSGSKWSVIRDGSRVGGEYEGASFPVFSPDGRWLAFAAKSGGKWSVIRDGSRVSTEYDEIGRFHFSPDGRSLAFAAKSGRKWSVVRDGVPGAGRYDLVWWLEFSPDGRSLAFAAKSGGKEFIVKDGSRVGGEYEGVWSPEFSPDGRSLAFIARSGDNDFVVKDGIRVGAKYHNVRSLRFSPDGRSLVFRAALGSKKFVVKDGLRVGKLCYDGLSNLETSADGKRLIFVGVREIVRRRFNFHRVEVPWQEAGR